jgi:3-phenylpropionate/trans-cinnamate dioxygenase ferredoxin subunit
MLVSDGFHFVTTLDEVPQGTNKAFMVEGQDVLICHTKTGEVYAVINLCSHALQKMEGGRMRGYKIMCPLHGASFDMRTGAVTGAPAYEPIKVFPVKVEDGRVYVQV